MTDGEPTEARSVPITAWSFADTQAWLGQNPVFARLADLVPVALFQGEVLANGESRIHYISRCCKELLGVEPEDVVRDGETAIRSRVHPADLDEYIGLVTQAAEDGAGVDADLRFLHGEATVWLHLHVSPERTATSVRFHGYLGDVTERKQQEIRILDLAFHDWLTGLGNRRWFARARDRAVAEHRSRGTIGALLIIDLDDFKRLNDAQGHALGDAVLVEVGARLAAAAGPGAAVARVGGDEFAMIVDLDRAVGASAADEVRDVADRVVALVHSGVEVGALRHVASASVGAVEIDGTQSSDECMRRADVAMYRAKRDGKDGACLYDVEEPALLGRRYELAMDFPRAMSDGQLQLHLQPQVDSRGVVRGAEGLARWEHPSHGLLGPGAFIELAVEFGMWTEAQLHLVDQAIHVISEWAARPELRDLDLAVNLDVASFMRADVVSQIARRVGGAGIDPRRLTLEVTESVFASDLRLLASHMGRLEELGVRTSLDDFGTGYSSFAYLADLPFDEVKLDGRYVSGIAEAPRQHAIVRTTIELARSLDLQVVAEFVERPTDRDVLVELGCDRLQGHLYGRAMPRSEFERRVRAASRSTP